MTLPSSARLLVVHLLFIGACAFSQSLSLNDGLIAYFRFDGNANDATTNANHGTPINVSFTPKQLSSADEVAVFGGALDQWIEVPDSESLNTLSNITISMWCYNARVDNSDVRFLCGKAYEQLEIHIGGIPNNPASGLRFIPGNAIIDTLDGMPTQEWFHLTCVVGPAAGTNFIFINGQPVAVTVSGDPHGVLGTSASRFAIGMRGGDPGWPHFDGKLNELRIYNRALTDSEVARLYEGSPRLELLRTVQPRLSDLSPGSSYQLQISTNLTNWTDFGASFVATNETIRYPECWDLTESSRLYFRAKLLP